MPNAPEFTKKVDNNQSISDDSVNSVREAEKLQNSINQVKNIGSLRKYRLSVFFSIIKFTQQFEVFHNRENHPIFIFYKLKKNNLFLIRKKIPVRL